MVKHAHISSASLNELHNKAEGGLRLAHSFHTGSLSGRCVSVAKCCTAGQVKSSTADLAG